MLCTMGLKQVSNIYKYIKSNINLIYYLQVGIKTTAERNCSRSVNK